MSVASFFAILPEKLNSFAGYNSKKTIEMEDM